MDNSNNKSSNSTFPPSFSSAIHHPNQLVQQEQNYLYSSQFHHRQATNSATLTTPTTTAYGPLISLTTTNDISLLDRHQYSSWYFNNETLLSPSTDDTMNRHHTNSTINKELNIIPAAEREIAGFVSKLYQYLQAPDDGHKYAHWCRNNGIDMFVIDCIPKFTETVLPRLFKHCKFASFVRQLNIYGFQRDTDARKSKENIDKATCRWHHIHFKSGRQDLLHLIQRRSSSYSRKKKSKADQEDTETILNIDSGDDGVDNFEGVKRSATTINFDGEEDAHYSITSGGFANKNGRSVAPNNSSSIALLQHQNHQTAGAADYNTNTPTINNEGFNMIYHVQQQEEHNSFSPFSLAPRDYYQIASMNEINQNLLIPSCKAVKSANLLLHQSQESSVSTQQPTQYQLYNQNEHHQLQLEIVQLRREYLEMYKSLTIKVDQANSLIQVQKSKINYLESRIQKSHQASNSVYLSFGDSNDNYYSVPLSGYNLNTPALRQLSYSHSSSHDQHLYLQIKSQLPPKNVDTGIDEKRLNIVQ